MDVVGQAPQRYAVYHFLCYLEYVAYHIREPDGMKKS